VEVGIVLVCTEKPMAKQKPDAVTVAGTHMALSVHVVGVHELKLKDTLGEQNTALGQVRSHFCEAIVGAAVFIVRL